MVVGELNIDLIFDKISKPPELSKEQRADEMVLTMGSSSAIFAVNSSNMGLDVAFCGKAGTDSFGDFVMQSLAGNRVNTEAVIRDDSLKTGATVFFNYSGDRMGVTHPGAMEQMTVEEIPDRLYSQSRHLHTSAIFFQPGIKQGLFKMFKKARDYGLTTSLDIQWDPEEKWDIDLYRILPVLDFFLPNESELLHLTGGSDMDDSLRQLSGYETTIVVKRGKEGAVMQKNGKRTAAAAYNVPDFIDAVGAGDSFDAGFIHAYLKEKPLEECLAFGTLAAAVSTTEAGGTGAIKSYEDVLNHKNKFETVR